MAFLPFNNTYPLRYEGVMLLWRYAAALIRLPVLSPVRSDLTEFILSEVSKRSLLLVERERLWRWRERRLQVRRHLLLRIYDGTS